MSWTEIQLKQLRQFYEPYRPGDELPVAEIALMLRKSEASVKAMANKMGLLSNYSTDERQCRKCEKQFFALGYEVSRGGGEFCSVACSSGSRRVPKPSKEALASLYEEGNSTNDLAEHFGVAKGTIYNWMRSYELSTRSFSKAAQVRYDGSAGQGQIDAARETKLSRHGKLMFGKGGHRGGKREDLGVFVRSSWEGNVLRWFNFIGVAWEYEPRTFDFLKIKRGTRSYTPDIYLPEEDLWIEVKGYLSDKDKTKTKRFQKYFPEEAAKLQVIVQKEGCPAAMGYWNLGVPVYAFYNDIAITKALVPNWE